MYLEKGEKVMESTMDVWKEFNEKPITHSGAHRLLAIQELFENRGYARVTDIARFLDITTGSASTNLKSLKTKGYVVEDDNRFLKLSDTGQLIAEAILSRRQTLVMFFTDVLGVSEAQAEVDACKTEHLLSAETTSKMQAFAKKYSKKQ